MTRDIRTLPVFLVAVVALNLAAASPNCIAGENEIPFADASIFFELNDTDGDLGIHAMIDAEGWKKLEIEDPRERAETRPPLRAASRTRKRSSISKSHTWDRGLHSHVVSNH